MTRLKGKLAGCLLIALFLLTQSHGIAGNIHLGSLRIHPYVSGSAGYTDNVYLTKTRTKSDSFYLLSPGVKLTLPIEKHAINVDYTVDRYVYKEQDEANRTVHNATGTLDLNPGNALKIQVRDTFTRSEDPPDFKEDRTSPFVWNKAAVDGIYDITNRLAVGLGYEHGTKRYDRSIDRIDDYDEDSFSGQIYVKVFPKMSLVTFYQYQDRDYDRRKPVDSETHRIEGGIAWKIGPKSTGTARVGYTESDYDQLNRTDDSLSYFVSLTHQLRPRTILSVEGIRLIMDTSQADDNLPFSNAYVSTQITGTLSHGYRKFTGRVKGTYIQDDYLYDDLGLGKKRHDDLFRAEFGIDHAIRKWFTWGGIYRYSRLNSNVKTEEYEENTFLIHVSLIL
jgi:hypothetical protein